MAVIINWLIIVLVFTIATLVCNSVTRNEQPITNHQGWGIVLSILNAFILMIMLIYLVVDIYPVWEAAPQFFERQISQPK